MKPNFKHLTISLSGLLALGPAAMADVQLGPSCKPVEARQYRLKLIKLSTLDGQSAGTRAATDLMAKGRLHQCEGLDAYYIIVLENSAYQVARRYVQTTEPLGGCQSRRTTANTHTLGSPGAGNACH